MGLDGETIAFVFNSLGNRVLLSLSPLESPSLVRTLDPASLSHDSNYIDAMFEIGTRDHIVEAAVRKNRQIVARREDIRGAPPTLHIAISNFFPFRDGIHANPLVESLAASASDIAPRSWRSALPRTDQEVRASKLRR